jgi:hypothetical protein
VQSAKRGKTIHSAIEDAALKDPTEIIVTMSEIYASVDLCSLQNEAHTFLLYRRMRSKKVTPEKETQHPKYAFLVMRGL